METIMTMKVVLEGKTEYIRVYKDVSGGDN